MSASRRRDLVTVFAYGLVLVSLIVLGVALFGGVEWPPDAQEQRSKRMSAEVTVPPPAGVNVVRGLR